MKTYLLTWNPTRWQWIDLDLYISKIRQGIRPLLRWSCGTTKSIQKGDRVFLMKLGKDLPKGIIGSGYAKSTPQVDEHWGGEDKKSLYIEVEFDILLNSNEENILSINLLNNELSKQIWTPQASGITVKSEIAEELEILWSDLQKVNLEPKRNAIDVNLDSSEYREGAVKRGFVTTYERNNLARECCLKHYGYSCSACGFNFEEFYGKLGKNFIQVHHINPIATIGKEYKIDPIKDMMPVCSNCHSMIHRSQNTLSIEQLKSIIAKKDL